MWHTSRVEPFLQTTEVNIHFEDRDVSVCTFFYFLVHKLKECTVVDWKFTHEPQYP